MSQVSLIENEHNVTAMTETMPSLNQVLAAARLSVSPYVAPIINHKGKSYTFDNWPDEITKNKKATSSTIRKYISKHKSAISLLMIKDKEEKITYRATEVAERIKLYMRGTEIKKILEETHDPKSKIIHTVLKIPEFYLQYNEELSFFLKTEGRSRVNEFVDNLGKAGYKNAIRIGLIKNNISKKDLARIVKNDGISAIIDDNKGKKIMEEFHNLVKIITYSSSKIDQIIPVLQNFDWWSKWALESTKPYGERGRKQFLTITDGIHQAISLLESKSEESNDGFSKLKVFAAFDPSLAPYLDKKNFGIKSVNEGIENIGEPSSIFREVIDKGRKPDLLIIGGGAIANPLSQNIAEDYMIICGHQSQTLQFVTKESNGGIPKNLRIAADSNNASNWNSIQQMVIKKSGTDARIDYERKVNSYKEVLELFEKGEINFGVVRNPWNFFIESLEQGYMTGDLEVIKEQTNLEFPSLVYGSILAKKETFVTNPSLLKFVCRRINEMTQAFKTNPRLFNLISTTTDFHKHGMKMVGVSKNEVKKKIDERVIEVN